VQTRIDNFPCSVTAALADDRAGSNSEMEAEAIRTIKRTINKVCANLAAEVRV
jgi:hypothetical protein